MKNNLILTVGLPYSGKTSWALGHSSIPIVNPDSIRLATHGQRYQQETEPLIWAMAKIFVRSLFLAGHKTVIVDATHNTEKRRELWGDDLWTRSFIVMDISKDACIERAKKNDDQEILPIIERMAEEQEFNGIYYGSNDLNEPMADHIKRPDGLKDLQIYHQGMSLDN